MENCCSPVRCSAHAEALLRLAQGDLAQPRLSPGATAMVLHHMERLELHGIWRAEAEVAIRGGTSVRASCKQSTQCRGIAKMCSLLLSCLPALQAASPACVGAPGVRRPM